MGLSAHAGRPSAASYIASMTEDQARQVLLLQAQESAGDTPTWQPADRSWATRQTVATVGEQATPETFVVARAALALQRLLPRDPAAQRWLGRRAWHPAWVALALLLGLMAGLAVDQLGPPQRVNLLAPAVWVLVAWNLLVYAALLLPLKLQGVRGWLSRWALRGHEHVAVAWARHAAPLTGARLALVLHAAAATLALGLVAGLYLRGLVLDYRAGWQSTFATADQVQTALRWLLAPASAITGIAVPDVAPLRVGPGADATASAAPWIHLLAATLLLAVVLPRSLLAWRAGVRATKLTQRFPLPLDTPYFEALHPLMRPGLPPTVRLLWLNLVEATADGPPVRLFDTLIERDIHAVQTLLRSEEGDTLQLHPVPAGVEGALVPAAAAPWWKTWWPAGATLKSPLARLRDDTDAVLLLTRPGAAEPAWLAALDRPQLTLVDTPDAEPPRLSTHRPARADGWLDEGLFLSALDAALLGDPRLPRLRQAWVAQQRARLDAGTQVLADSLARIAATHQAVADQGFLARRAEAEAARAALALALDAEWRLCEERLVALLGRADSAAGEACAAPNPAAQLRSRLGEGRAALMGGVVTGALAGLKADVLSGGLTMGAGLVAGGVIGAIGAAGMAKGLNVVRGTDRSFAAWDDAALAPITQALLQRYLVLAHGQAPDLALQRLKPALVLQQTTLATLWRGRDRRFNNDGESDSLARVLQPLLSQAVLHALGTTTGLATRSPTATGAIV